jgi:uncharacterized membrane protein YhiD involved in acid resistance
VTGLVNELWEYAAKIALSALLSGAVGAERQRTGKWAGLRTFMLIAVGSAMLTDLSIRIGPRFAGSSSAWDPGRIAAQIVTGVGFIGAGTIIQLRGSVRGLTSAAGIWVACAIGMAVGASFYAEAVVGTVALVMILGTLRPLARVLTRNLQVVSLVLGEGSKVSRVTELLEQVGIEPERLRVVGSGADRRVLVHFRGSGQLKEKLIREAAARDLGVEDEEE